MAYFQSDDEEDKVAQGMNQQGSSEPSAPQQQQMSGGVSTSTAPASPSSAQASAPKPTSSGMSSFKNIQNANQGQAQDSLNKVVAQRVANAGTQAVKSVNQATNQFGQRVDAGSLANSQNAVNDVKNVLAGIRNSTAPAAQAPSQEQAQATDGTNNVLSQAVAQPQQSRFAEVINAKYQGPESLRQSGLYEATAGKVRDAQTDISNAKTATGREELLKKMYQDRGNYSSGLNKLDAALLNASQPGVQNLQNVAKQQGDVGQKLDQAQIASANLAQNRTNEIAGIRNTARNEFTTQKTAEEQATESRLDKLLVEPALDGEGKPIPKLDAEGKPLVGNDGKPVYQTQWDQLPEYYRDIIRNKKNTNDTVLQNSVNEFKTANNYDAVNAEYQPLADAIAKAQKQIEAINWNAALAAFNGMSGDISGIGPLEEKIAMLSEKIKPSATKKAELDAKLADINNKFNKDAIIFNPFEAETLGIKSGEGLYNAGTDIIATGVADRNKLISKDEQFRQAAMAALAGLDEKKLLSSNLKYDKANLAGTQSILDSLDTDQVRKNLNAQEEGFRDMAQNLTLTGYGAKKNKTSGKRYYAQESANFGELLKNAGYDFNKELNNTVGNADLLKLLESTSNGQVTQDPSGLAGAISGNTEILSNMGDGQSLGQTQLDLLGIGGALGFISPSMVTGFLGEGSLGSSLGGLFGGSSASESKSDAARFAREDLQRQVKQTIKDSGFQNRAAVASNSAVNDRINTLQQLISRLDKTNS